MELKNFFAQDLQGNVIASPTAYLYQPGTTTLATGLQDAYGNPLTNPFTGNATGQLQLAAPDGDYDLRVTGPGRYFTMRVRFVDASPASAQLLRDDLAATGGAALVGYGAGTVADALEAAAPITTQGDLVVGGAGGTPARLPKGVDGKVLKMVSGAPAWGDVASGTTAIPIAASDESTALTTGVAKVTFRMPFAFTLTAVRASVTTAPTGSALTVDINEGGASILSTKLTIDASEKTSMTAATPSVISDTALADDAEITIDIDTVGSTVAGAGLKVYLIGTVA